MSFNEKLQTLLKSDQRFVDKDGDLLKSEVIDKAWKIDRKLIELLLDDESIKSKFFDEIKGHWIFNINTFIDYVQDKNFYDSSYTKFRNKIGLTIDGKFLKGRGEVALVWPYKDCILEGGQTKEEEKRKEIFFNEVLAQDEIDRLLDPKVMTNFKRYTVNGEEKVTEFKRDKDGTIRENLIIKGNNLLALHSLKTQFRGKVKLIYIDPPFNTASAANTFAYNNNFNHSVWLTFMKNRIESAKNILLPNGIFVVSIDHYELFYLGVLCDEVFGRENRMGVISVVHNPGGRQDDIFFPTAHENMLFYAKDILKAEIFTLGANKIKISQYVQSDIFGNYKLRGFRRSGNNSKREQRPGLFYPIYYNPKTNHISLEKIYGYIEILPIDEKGIERCWRWGKETFLEKFDKYLEVKKTKKNRYDFYIKEREDDYKGEKPKTIWDKSKYTGQTATSELKKIFGDRVFSYPKSVFLIMDVMKITTRENDIVLDFFAGSGTTAHAVLNLNKEDGGKRKFVLCEQMDYAESITAERVKKVITNNKNGNFIYCELMKYNEAFVERIRDAENSEALLTIWEDMKAHSFLNYNIDIKKMDESIEEFKKLPVAKQKEMLMGILNKNQLYVNLSEIEDQDFKVSDEAKQLNRLFYGD